ncbi:MAG: response regulator [Nitrospirota bacterium]|nr:response regulator [Nitrospirota bacterium]
MDKTPRILVVDDEMSIRGILNELFTALNYDVVEAPSVEVALVKMELIQFELVISDIRMAGQSGIELLKKIKETNPETEVIIMTSHSSLESSLEAIRLGAYDYLLKPFEELEYVEIVVSRALAHRRLKKENQALLSRTSQKNSQIEQETGQGARDLIEVARFYKLASSILKSKNLGELTPHLEKGLSLFLKGKPGIIWLFHEEKGVLFAKKTLGTGAIVIPQFPLLEDAHSSDAERCLWMRKGEYKSRLNQVLAPLAPQALIHQPLIYQDKVYGLLTVVNRLSKSWSVHEKNTFVHLCLITAMMLHFFKTQNMNIPTQFSIPASSMPPKQGVLTMQDQQTGLVHYDYFLELLYLETQRARRYRHPFTLLLLRFRFSAQAEKKVEMHGFLQDWAKQVLSEIRTTDIAAGDDNCIFVLLPETSLRESRKVMRILKRQMSSLSAMSKSKGTSVLSAESCLEKAVYPKDGDTVDGLISVLKSRIGEH